MSTLARPAAPGTHPDLVASIGNTPMVELRRLSPQPGARLFAKLEGANPTGSVKDRVARAMLADAIASGALQPGQTILEPSSGNTGISLAMIGARLGHPVRIVMPDNTTAERSQLLRLFGAEIVSSPGAEGSNGAIRLARVLSAADASLFMPYQYGNEANPRAHYDGTAPEILEELDEVAAFVGGLGTGGTLMGNGPPPEGERRQDADRRRRADAGRVGAGATLARRRLHPADHRPLAARSQDHGLPTTTRSSGPRSCSTRRVCSRASRLGRSPSSQRGSQPS